MTQAFVFASSMIKTIVGVTNNAAWMACLDAIDKIRQHPRYHASVKGGTTVGRSYKRVFDALKAYERRLIFTDENRFFHLADMDPKARKIFGNITDRDYYDFWAAFGFTAYESTRPFFTSLVNKLRLAYQAHGEQHAEILAYSNAAGMALDLAVEIFNHSIDRCMQEWPQVPERLWRRTFGAFSLSHVADLWMAAHNNLDPGNDYRLSDAENHNIILGYAQLRDMWIDEKTLFDSRIKTAEDFAEVFRTNGEMKKAQRQFAEMRDMVAAEREEVRHG